MTWDFEAYRERMRDLEARWDLSDEMKADGWRPIADVLVWMHTPSGRAVSIEERTVPPWIEGTKPGWYMVIRIHDEHGNPYEGESMGPMPLGRALRQAVIARRMILEERPAVPDHEQLELLGGGA